MGKAAAGLSCGTQVHISQVMWPSINAWQLTASGCRKGAVGGVGTPSSSGGVIRGGLVTWGMATPCSPLHESAGASGGCSNSAEGVVCCSA